MTGRRAATGAALLAALSALWIYIANLRYERSFYQRWLLEAGRDPNL